MATSVQIATDWGMKNAQIAADVAAEIGLPLYAAYALLQMESKGDNIYGGDSGGIFAQSPRKKVTESNYKEFRRRLAAGEKTNGVGPSQVTHRSHFPKADAWGLKLWRTDDNMRYGFTLLLTHYQNYKTWERAGRAYNGKESYGKTFTRVVGEWKDRLKSASEAPMATWHLAPSLKRLQKDLDAVFGADRPNDGTIGDQAHAARKSEHNPDRDADSMPNGAVSAIDIYTQVGSKVWIKPAEFTKLLAVLKKDARVWYVIHKGYIYSRTDDFAKEKYTGSNPHTNHIHISLMQTKAAHDDVSSWGIGAVDDAPKPAEPKPSTKKPLPTLRRGDRDKVLVPFLKRFFWADPPNQDSVFGSGTEKKVKAYQREQGLMIDGVVGPKTWARIASGTKLPEGYKLP